MPVCQIPLRERSRGTLGMALMMVNCIIAGMAHVVLFLGIYIRFELGTKTQLLKSYNPDVLFHMMLSIAATLIVFHAPGAKICYDCGNWKTRDRFHACFFFWLLAALLVSLVPVTALVLCAVHKGLIETALVAGFSEAAVRYKLDLATKSQLDRLQVSHRCCGAKGFDDWMRISWVNMDDVKPSKQFAKSSYRSPEGELILPWAPWSCCNASILMVCDTIWEFIPHGDQLTNSRRRRRSLPASRTHMDGIQEPEEDSRTILPPGGSLGEEMPWNPGGVPDRNESKGGIRHSKLSSLLSRQPVNVISSPGVFTSLFHISNFTRRRRSPFPEVKTTDKKKLPHAPKRHRKKSRKPPKPIVSKAFANGFPKFSLHGMSLHSQGPIGSSKTDSPFESKLDVLLPKLELEAAVTKLDGWYHPPKISRQALQEKIFHRVGCGEAMSKTVFWVIGMGMTTLLTIWIFQLIMLMLARWLQTSMDLAYNWGNPKMMAPGYIMKQWPCSSGPAPDIEPPDAAFYEEELEQSSEEEEEEERSGGGHKSPKRHSQSSQDEDEDEDEDEPSETDDSTGYGEDSSGFGDLAGAMGGMGGGGGGRGGGGGEGGGGDDDDGDDSDGGDHGSKEKKKKKRGKGEKKKKKKGEKKDKKDKTKKSKKKSNKATKGKKGEKGKKGKKKKKGSKKKTKKGKKKKGKKRKKR